jgi:hypothetical protein
VILKRFTEFASSPRAKRIGSVFGVVAGTWFWTAVVAMFFTDRYPALHSFAWWTFAIWAGTFIVGIMGLVVVGPGIYGTKKLYEIVYDPQASTFETRLTQMWCAVGGLFLSLLLGVAAALIVFGPLTDVKLWFIGVCWVLLMLPWVVLGSLGRSIIRRGAPPRHQDAE